MKRLSLSVVAFAALGSSFGALAGACGGREVPIGIDNAGDAATDAPGDLDDGSGLCGAAACSAGQRCCASADESCSPTCMSVDKCPVYGRPCNIPTDGGAADAGSSLRWYDTCGDPVCRDPPDAGGPVDSGVCPTLGEPCSEKGQTCGDGIYTCGVVRVCDDHDPRPMNGNGCPISSAKFKDGITYLTEAELRALHDETIDTRLATYQYKSQFGDPGLTHLGFIVEDQPQSFAVDRGHDRVDLYGYVSMVVATMQVQEKEIQELKQEVWAARDGCRATPTSSKR